MSRSEDETTIRIRSKKLGRRASSFAIQLAERFRYLGDAVGEYEITFAKQRHARHMLKLQERDVQEGVW